MAAEEEVRDPLDEEFHVVDERDRIQPVPRAFAHEGLGRHRGQKMAHVGGTVHHAGIYWLYGTSPKGHPNKSEVSDPPCSGYSSVFVIDPGEHSKLVTLFCPHSFGAWQVSRHSYEFFSLYRRFGGWSDEARAFYTESLPRVWGEHRRRQWESRYDVAAIVMQAIGLEVPKDEDLPQVQVKQTGGKQLEEGAKLTKPVKRSGRRGEVLAFFLEAEGHRASVHSATAKFGITRSNLLSQLFLLKKEHGIGYTVEGDTAAVQLPEGCEDPFA